MVTTITLLFARKYGIINNGPMHDAWAQSLIIPIPKKVTQRCVTTI